MSERKSKLREGLTTRRLLVILLCIAGFAMALREIHDPDLWWHLATGRYIWEQRQIPRVDVFSHTMRGTRWYTHEWLAEVIFYGLYRLGGEAALIVGAAGIVALTLMTLYAQCQSRPYAAAFVVILGAVASAITWGVRPQMFTFLFAALYMGLIEKYRQRMNDQKQISSTDSIDEDGQKIRANPFNPLNFLHSDVGLLCAFPLLMIVWVNAHGGYFLGLALLAGVICGDGLARLVGWVSPRTLSWAALRALGIALGGCVLATLINPNGYHMLWYPFETLTSSAMQTYIQEWASPNFHNSDFWPFAALLLGGAALMVGLRHRPDLTDGLLFFGLGGAGLLSARHIPLFVVIAVPVVSRALTAAKVPQSRRNFTALNWAILALALLATGARLYVVLEKNRADRATRYPQAALAYIESHGLRDAAIYNSYKWGGYLVWQDIPVFIDGRADVYGDAFIEQFLTAYFVRPGWRAALDAYRPDYVLIEARATLAVLLDEAPEWERVYTDDVSVIFVRETK
ncbi:MAG TPA: hypothetical protein PKH77_01830 [Anaerolineae bacterium]|nr:hypothetical protein [Anaerolineae bacterium]